MPLADDFQQILDALPPDWTDLEVDLRIDDESQYVDSAVALSQVNAQVYRTRGPGGTGACSSPTASATPPRRRPSTGVLAKLDADGVDRRDAGRRGARGPLRGRADVGPAGERARRVPPAPRDLGRGPGPQHRHRPDARQPGRRGADRRRPPCGPRPLAGGAPLDGVELIVADLDAEDPEALVGLGVPVLGYYSHVDVETRQAAERPGSIWSCRARGWRANCRAGRAACSAAEAAASRRSSATAAPSAQRAREQAVFEVPGRPCAQDGRVEGAGRRSAAGHFQLGLPVRRVRVRGWRRAGRRGPARGPLGEGVAAAGRGDHRFDQLGVVLRGSCGRW